jgi:succinate-semialdehyde dehydrogenase / glutarate-semialdehyde dehydrogenase
MTLQQSDQVVAVDPRLLERLLAHASVAADCGSRAVIAPFTGQPLYDLPLSDEPAIEGAFRRARTAQATWAQVPVRQRARIMLAFHDLLLRHRNEALDLVQLETGKARKDAMEEVLDIAVTTRHYARDAHRLLRPLRHRGVFPLMIGVRELRHPRGVVGIIAPWNYPLTLAASDAVPALLAGNAVVLKPDPQTTLAALWVAERLAEAGLPAGLFAVVTGEGPVAGPMVIDRSDFVMFTGSTRVGREVAARCGERLIGCSLELGGKNAMIVRADASIARAADIAVRASFSNCGQLCISMERIYVHQSAYPAFVEAFVKRTQAMRVSASVGWGSDMGSLISARQRDRVLTHIDDAVRKGASVLAGARPRPDLGPYVVEPTILADVTEDMILCDEETFGPVVAVYHVRDDEEAIRLANDTPYGLNASVITADVTAGQRIAARLRAGTANVNEGYAPAWGSTRAPMGGMGDSGLGRRHGAEGLLKYTEAQTVATQRFLGFGAPFGWSDRRWGETLAWAVGAMKRLRLK